MAALPPDRPGRVRAVPGRPGRPGRVRAGPPPRTGTPVAPDELRISSRPVQAATPPGLVGRLGSRVEALLGALLARDVLVLAALLVLAAAVRLPGLASRGDFDGDQGHDMLTLLRFVREGVVPLLGPPTSVGDFHHGAAYYFLLAPVVWLFGPNPIAVLAFIAALGTAAVGITWWFARAVGGRATGLMAGLLMAVSPAAIEESTFIWNPSPIPFFAILALAAAWRAHRAGRARWWTLAVASAG
ncbi:MAG: phospholipid carrier-dependent glycosyltransferase, partial [Chloroflexi bacterium]|nr:phospholipid carrier-dependent glycosyltransferase [Chloroflexota bacterium]